MSDINYNTLAAKYNRRVQAVTALDKRYSLVWTLPECSHINEKLLNTAKDRIITIAQTFVDPDTVPNLKTDKDKDWDDITPYWTAEYESPAGSLVLPGCRQITRQQTSEFSESTTGYGTRWIERVLGLSWHTVELGDDAAADADSRWQPILEWLNNLLDRCCYIGFYPFDSMLVYGSTYRQMVQYFKATLYMSYYGWTPNAEEKLPVNISKNGVSSDKEYTYTNRVEEFPALISSEFPEPILTEYDYDPPIPSSHQIYQIQKSELDSTAYISEIYEGTVSFWVLRNLSRLPCALKLWHTAKVLNGSSAHLPWEGIETEPTLTIDPGSWPMNQQMSEIASTETDLGTLQPNGTVSWGFTQRDGSCAPDFTAWTTADNDLWSEYSVLTCAYDQIVIVADFRKTFNELGETYNIEE